jgi:hypothetical protein
MRKKGFLLNRRERIWSREDFGWMDGLRWMVEENGGGGVKRIVFVVRSILTVFNQRWIFLKRDQMKQEKEGKDAEGLGVGKFGGTELPSTHSQNARAKHIPNIHLIRSRLLL